MIRRLTRNEAGITVLPTLVVVMLISTIGFAMVGVMNTDITHATIQGTVSRAHFITQAGLQEGIVRLKADPLYRTAAYPAGVAGTSYGGGGQFWIWVEDYAEDTVTITVRGRGTSAGRTVTAEIRAIALVGPPIPFGLFGVSTVVSSGANSRTYLAPWRPSGPGVPRGANMGSFFDINFQDAGSRLNAVSETGVDTVTLREGIPFNDWELFGFTSRPSYDPNEPLPWILGAFGDIVKAQPDTGGPLHSCTPPTNFACLTVQNGSNDIVNMYELRETENLGHVYMSRVRKRMLPVATLDPTPILEDATANTGNSAVNAVAGISHANAVYTADEFHCLLAYVEANPATVVSGTLYVTGDVQLGGNLNIGCNGGRRRPTNLEDQFVITDGTLAIEGNLTMENNSTLTIRHDNIYDTDPAIADPARKKIALALFPGAGANSWGRLIMQGGSQQKLVADGLIYTSDGVDIGAQALVDIIGAMYHNTTNNTRPSFDSNNATTVIRYDALAGSRLASASAIAVTILSWQQLR
jgi:hypothetical protein